MNSYRLSIYLSISLSFPPCASLVKYLFVFPYPPPSPNRPTSPKNSLSHSLPPSHLFFCSSDFEEFNVFPDNLQWLVSPTVGVYRDRDKRYCWVMATTKVNKIIFSAVIIFSPSSYSSAGYANAQTITGKWRREISINTPELTLDG